MTTEFAEQVYNTLTGQYSQSTYGVPGVENTFAPGQPCQLLYRDAFDAYQRICDRLGVIDEDDDLEIIMNALLDIGQITGMHMFHYGVIFSHRFQDK